MQNNSCSTRYSIVQELSIKQSAKVICFDRHRTAYSKRQKSHMSIEKIIFHLCITLQYIVLRVNRGLTSCEDLATALMWSLISSLVAWFFVF